MFDENTDPLLIAHFQSAARICALAVAVLGLAVLLGWALDIAALKSVLPGWVTMKANTALAFVLAGASLLVAGRQPLRPGWRKARLVLAAAVMLLGGLTLGEYLLGADFGIDQLLFTEPADVVGTAPPGRMAVATAAGFALTGLALLLLDCGRWRIASQFAALIGNLVGVLALLGYAYGVNALHGVGALSAVALHTAVGLVTINFGILLVRPQRGLMAVLSSRTLGGVMARRLLPFALFAPFLIGWLRIQGERQGLFDSGFGVALVAVTYVVLFTAFIWRTADSLRRSDQQRSAAERARRQQQAQLAGIIDSAMDAIIMVDAGQRVVVFNPAAEAMFGRPAAEVLGGPHDVLLPQRFQSSHLESMRQYAANGASSRRMGELGVVTGVRANGEEFPIEASISRLEADGEQYFTVILRDITESRRVQEALRESEARERGRSEELSKLLDSVPAAVWLAHDAEAKLITGNQLSYDWLQLPDRSNVSRSTPAGEAPGNFRIVKDGVELAPADMPLQLAAAGAVIRDYEFDFVHADGRRRRVLGNATPLFDEQGKPRGAISAFVDITARRDAELAMQVAKADAERANNAKSRFLAAASHDLRQPLSALTLYTSVLKERLSAAEQPLLANMQDCLGSLNELLTDLLDLSKLEAGVVTPHASDFPIAATLASLEAIHAPEARLKGLRLRCINSRLTAHTDPVLYKRMLGNLIDNAIRYSERGGVLVACRRRQGKTWVEVRDSGVGIPADKTGEIFEEFKQLGDQARTRGSGLGLAIVARTAALLGLEIRVSSRLGRGSLFAIELPLGQAPTMPAPPPDERGCRPLRIAVVDDNTLVLDACAAALRHAGHEVLAAASGEALLAELDGLDGQALDVVVSDFRLGRGETGYEVIMAVRTRSRADLPAILITGDTDPQLLRSMADRDIVVLHKPVEMETLQAYLEDLTAQSGS